MLPGMGPLLRIANGRCLPLCYLEAKGNGIPPAVHCGVVLTSGQRAALSLEGTKNASLRIGDSREELAF